MYWVPYTIEGDEAPEDRCEHTSTELGTESKIILFGGTNGKKYFEDVWLLKIKTDERRAIWSSIECTGSGPTSGGLCGHTATLVGRKLYIFGGRNQRGSFADMYQLDCDLKHWEKVSTFGISPCARFGHSAVVLPGTRSIGIFGGTAADKRFSFEDFYVLDTTTNEWTMLFSLSGEAPRPRYAHTCSPADNHVVLFGGKDSDIVLDDLHTLTYDGDAQGGEWEILKNTRGAPEGRLGHASFSFQSRVFIWGGLTHRNTLSHEFFSYHQGGWSCHHEYEFDAPPGRVYHSLTRIKNHVFILGGSSTLAPNMNPVVQSISSSSSSSLTSSNSSTSSIVPSYQVGPSAPPTVLAVGGGRSSTGVYSMPSNAGSNTSLSSYLTHNRERDDEPPTGIPLSSSSLSVQNSKRPGSLSSSTSSGGNTSSSGSGTPVITSWVSRGVSKSHSASTDDAKHSPTSSGHNVDNNSSSGGGNTPHRESDDSEDDSESGRSRSNSQGSDDSGGGSSLASGTTSMRSGFEIVDSGVRMSVFVLDLERIFENFGSFESSSTSLFSASKTSLGTAVPGMGGTGGGNRGTIRDGWDEDKKRQSMVRNLTQGELLEMNGPLTSPENLTLIVCHLFNKKTGAIRILVDESVAFSGYDILHWLVQTLRIERSQALIIGKALQVEGYLENTISDKATFTDSSELYQPTKFAKEQFQIDLTIDLKTEINRTNIVTEILNTEKKYVFDLGTLIEVYMKPLLAQFKEHISSGQVSNIFSNVNQIEKLNSEFLTRITAVQKLPPEEQFIGKLFCEMSFLFRSYSSFCVNQSVADRDIKAIKKNPAIAKFLEDQRNLPECGKLDLESYIIKPLQRICRYPLLLRELLKNTYETHPDFKFTEQALAQFEEVVKDINEKKRASENQMAIIELQQLFYDEVRLLKPARKLLMDAEVKRVTSTGGASKRHIFLFNDLLVIAEEKLGIGPQKYKMKDSIPIRNCIVWDDGGKSEKSQRTFVIVRNDKKEKIKLQTESVKVKQQWVNEINNCIIGPLNVLDKDSQARRKAMEAFKAIQSGAKSPAPTK